MKNTSRITLYDKVVSRRIPIWSLEKVDDLDQFPDEVGQSVAFDISNVDDFYRAFSAEKGGFSVSRDLSCIMPPFERIWAEGRIGRSAGTPIEYAVLSTSLDIRVLGKEATLALPDCCQNAMRVSLDLPLFGAHGPLDPDKSLVQPDSIRGNRTRNRENEKIPNLLYCQTFIRTERGLCFSGLAAVAIGQYGEPLSPVISSQYGQKASTARVWQTFLFPAFLAFQFANCKNIRVAEQTPCPKLSRAHQRRYKHALTTHRVIDLGIPKTVLETEGGIKQNGLKKALHMCRGHFATYTPEKGMMGRKLEEPVTVWKPAHVRGNASEGMVSKDYRVKAPVGATS